MVKQTPLLVLVRANFVQKETLKSFIIHGQFNLNKQSHSTFMEKQKAHLCVAVLLFSYSAHLFSCCLPLGGLKACMKIKGGCRPPALNEEQIIWTPGLERSVNLLGL